MVKGGGGSAEHDSSTGALSVQMAQEAAVLVGSEASAAGTLEDGLRVETAASLVGIVGALMSNVTAPNTTDSAAANTKQQALSFQLQDALTRYATPWWRASRRGAP